MMYRKLGFKIFVISLMLFIPLALVTIQNAQAGSPRPEGAQERGRFIVGHVTVKSTASEPCLGGADVTIEGRCPQGGQILFTSEWPNIQVAGLTEQIVFDVTWISPPECLPGNYITVSIDNWEVIKSALCPVELPNINVPQPHTVEFDLRAVYLD